MSNLTQRLNNSTTRAPIGRPGSRGPRRWSALLACALPVLVGGCYHDDHGDYAPYPAVEASYGVVAADFNKDGHTDVIQLSTVLPIVAPNSSNLKIYLSTGANAFGAPTLMAAGTDPLAIVAADINLDGALDVATASYDDGTISVFFNNLASPGTFNPPLVLPSPGASQLAIGDVTGDGLPDIVSADFGVSLFVQSSAGTFAAPVSLYSGGANFVAIGDLNNDGLQDIALTDANGVKLLMNTSTGGTTSFASAVSIFTQTANANVQGGNIIAIGDVDGDLLNDLVITDPGPTGGMTPTVNVLIQDPANHGTFLPPVSYPIAMQDLPQSITLVDLTGSGKLDIVIGELNTVTVLLHDPANPGKFLPASFYAVTDANSVSVADVDGDGRLDIVVSNGATAPTVDGVITAHPGVLLQSSTSPGTFGALQDLP